MIRRFSLLLLVLALSGCATAPLRTDRVAKGQESRVQFLILHYTALDLPTSLRVLSEQNVSSHYLVGDDTPPTVWRLVEETNMAYHAGLSEWQGYSRLNPSSIGIEIVNRGYEETPQGRHYFPFPETQIERVIELVRSISARHHIKPEHILGHSEIAPQRKPDPGPLFPWKRLADAGLIPWPDAAAVYAARQQYESALPDVAWFQARLHQHGYTVPEHGTLDTATRNVLIAFQMRYRPTLFDGTPDAETAALLDVLTRSAKP